MVSLDLLQVEMGNFYETLTLMAGALLVHPGLDYNEKMKVALTPMLGNTSIFDKAG